MNKEINDSAVQSWDNGDYMLGTLALPDISEMSKSLG